MTGITLDSPVAAVLGSRSTKDKKKAEALAKGLGVTTVGELLRHFPRTYLKTGELTEVGSLQEGQPLTIVGEVLTSRVVTGRQAHRVEAVLKTDGPPLRLTVFARQHRIAEWQHRRLAPGASGVFTGKVGRFRDDWQLTNPQMVIFGEDDDPKTESAREMVGQPQGALPDLPRHRHASRRRDIQRVVELRAHRRRRAARAAPRGPAQELRRARRRHRAALDPRARRLGPGRCRPQAVPLRGGARPPSSCSSGAGPRSAPRAPGRVPGEAACWPPSTSGCRSS